MGNAKDKNTLIAAADLRSRAEILLKTKVPDPGFSLVDGEALRLAAASPA